MNMNQELTIKNQAYQLMVDKCLRMKLLKEALDLSNVPDSEKDSALANAIMPGIQRYLDKGLFDLYQVLYDIDIHEEMIKERITSLENPGMIPGVIAYAIVDRLKGKYQYQILISKS